MREIVLDTETTGLDPAAGHRIVEIAAIELVNHLPTGREFHAYVNPQRDMPDEAYAVHGLSAQFLSGHSEFSEIAASLVEFMEDSPLIIHNAGFDLKFLNAEFARIDRASLPPTRAIDTLLLARRKFPGAQAGLDALCRRFDIDNSGREKHSAKLDAQLLAAVYLELIGGRQAALGFLAITAASAAAPASVAPRPPRAHLPTAAELAAHGAFIATLKSPIWRL